MINLIKNPFFLFFMIISVCSDSKGQTVAVNKYDRNKGDEYRINNNFYINSGKYKADKNSFRIKVFTFKDLGVFSYFDSTSIAIYDESGELIGSALLIADTLYTLIPGHGFYWIYGNKPCTILLGDPFSGKTNGYFAIDENGKALSKKLNTWMMSYSYPHSDFIVFGYTDGTIFTVRNLIDKKIILTDTVDRGEHFSFREHGSVPYHTALQVTAASPVSALSYTDQDYYVPADNGGFSGTCFYGYSAYSGSWTNSITVTSYADSNFIAVTNSVTGDTINSYVAMTGQVHTEPIVSPTFWKVESLFPVTAANIPFAGLDGNYSYMTRIYDESGNGFGNLYFMPSIQITSWIFSLEDTNQVNITQLGRYDEFPYISQSGVWSGVLNEGEVRGFTSNVGNFVFKIEGSGKLYVIQSSGKAGADFIPLLVSSVFTDIKSVVPGDLDWRLEQNYPNPFNPVTRIRWSAPVSARHTLAIFDILGREVATLVDEFRLPGRYEIEFNGKNLPSGVYIYVLNAGNFTAAKKFVLLK